MMIDASAYCRELEAYLCKKNEGHLIRNWRRAVGVPAAETAGDPPESKQDSLPSHLDRVIARLTALRGSNRSAVFRERIDAAVRELDALRASAKQVRGEARVAILSRLVALDATLLDAAGVELDDETRADLARRAESEISPFASRMSPDARRNAVDAAFARLVRDAFGLPTLPLT